MNRPNFRTVWTAGLICTLALAACSNEPEEAANVETSDASDAEQAEVTPRTDAEGNEIISEGPDDDARPFGSEGGDGETADAGTALGDRDPAAPAISGDEGAAGQATPGASGASRSTMQSGVATQPGAKPPAGSKLQKADPR